MAWQHRGVNSHPNRYKPPAAPVTPRDPDGLLPRTNRLKFLAIAVAALATITAGLAPATLDSFRKLFADFGAELPLLSQFVLGSLWIWTLLAAVSIGIAIWIGLTGRASGHTLIRMRMAVALVAFAVVALFVISLVAVYLPIFRLGEVV